MYQRFTHLGFIAATALLGACTDGRPGRTTVNFVGSPPPPGTTLIPAAQLQYQDAAGNAQNTDALQMTIKGGSLYMTGHPYGFLRWEISQDAEEPTQTFAVARDIANFAGKDSHGRQNAWILDHVASTALSVFGTTAFMSGTNGSTVVNMSQTNLPKVVQWYPQTLGNSSPGGSIPQDPAYAYNVMVNHPSLPILYGFRRQDYLYTLNLSQGNLQIIKKEAYGNQGESVCCALGAAIFNNKMYVAFRDRLLFYDITASGALTNIKESTQLNAANVVATARYLYVQHEPTAAASGGSSRPSGIYVFDSSGKAVAFFKASSPKRFAISSDDNYIYSDLGMGRIDVFRIQWTN